PARGVARRQNGRPCQASGAFVEGNDAGAAEAEIVLQPKAGAADLGRLGRAAQLSRQLVALREAGGAERMALRQQATGRIGDDFAAIGIVAIVDEALGAALRTESQ